jgi:hypothetical protein
VKYGDAQAQSEGKLIHTDPVERADRRLDVGFNLEFKHGRALSQPDTLSGGFAPIPASYYV